MKVVCELDSSVRGSGQNRYIMCKGRLLLHPQYDAVQIGFVTQFLTMGHKFPFFGKAAMHIRGINDITVHKSTLLMHTQWMHCKLYNIYQMPCILVKP